MTSAEPDHPAWYRAMYRIRRFEETVLDNFSKGVFYGTTHTYVGQEADAVAVISHLQELDVVVSNHRSHGHFLAYGGSPRALFAELMGRQTGVCGGRGGSQHLHWKNFYSNGVLGGTIPLATGMAFAEKLLGRGAMVVAFTGDGALGEGVVYESLNMSALWKIPILYVLENNRIAQTTPVELGLAGSLADRFRAFGIPVQEIDSSDISEIAPLAEAAIAATRGDCTPHALVLHTCRFGPHSKGDDTRDPQEIARLRSTRDPLSIQAARLSKSLRDRIEAEVRAEIQSAFDIALTDPPAELLIKEEKIRE